MKTSQGYSLISKAGKNSYNRYKILTEKQEIIEESFKKPIKKQIKRPANKQKLLVFDLLKSSIIQDLENPKETTSKSINPAESAQITSHQSLKPSLSLKPSDFYTPSYSAQDKHIPTVKFQHSPIKTREKPQKLVKIHFHPSKPLKNPIFSHIPSCIPFKTQLSRKPTSLSKNLSQNSFFSYQFPSIHSVPDFTKQTSRGFFCKIPVLFPDYSPKKEFILKKLSKNILFDQYLPRKPLKKPNFSPNCYDINYSYIEAKPKTFRF